MNEAAAEVATPGLRRRALLRTVAVLGGLAAIKGIGRAVIGTVPPAGPTIGGPWQILTPTAAATITHVALALLGEPGQRAFAERGWRPADGVDRLLGGLAPDQQKALLGAIRLVEEWTPGWYGLSGLSPASQHAALESWRTSRLALRRSVWGFLHAATRSSFADSTYGWSWIGYPGPCRTDVGYAGRAPGQSVAFVWDERVP